ncbi:MAG: large-conductance mechanosensitive channel protein MscL [Planctomycetota bacterium]|nr:large-conductance mechanosensitive channel protein MscL [Planctomycetota bacterium]
MLKEFKDFAMKGNVMDMAVGIIIGGAFGKIIASFVNDVLMPPIGMLLGDVDFAKMYKALDGKVYETMEAAVEAGAPLLKYGAFFQSVVDFVIIAFSIFMMVRWLNNTKKKEEEAPAEPPKPSNEEVLLSEIRDLLKR